MFLSIQKGSALIIFSSSLNIAWKWCITKCILKTEKLGDIEKVIVIVGEMDLYVLQRQFPYSCLYTANRLSEMLISIWEKDFSNSSLLSYVFWWLPSSHKFDDDDPIKLKSNKNFYYHYALCPMAGHWCCDHMCQFWRVSKDWITAFPNHSPKWSSLLKSKTNQECPPTPHFPH